METITEDIRALEIKARCLERDNRELSESNAEMRRVVQLLLEVIGQSKGVAGFYYGDIADWSEFFDPEDFECLKPKGEL